MEEEKDNRPLFRLFIRSLSEALVKSSKYLVKARQVQERQDGNVTRGRGSCRRSSITWRTAKPKRIQRSHRVHFDPLTSSLPK